jgi:hypothetical protein
MISNDRHASLICAVEASSQAGILLSAFVTSTAEAPASRSASYNAIMCDRLTHCIRELTPPDAADDHQLMQDAQCSPFAQLA